MSGTIFALIPPIVAIALALITKEVYLSLLIGILSGAFLFTGLNPVHAVETVISIMGDKIGGNVNILLFLSFLGIVVAPGHTANGRHVRLRAGGERFWRLCF